MVFTVTFDIDPPGVFGLEEPYTTVTPPTPRGVPFGFVLDTQESKVIDKSKEFSTYRNEDEKIDVCLKLGDISCRILDNTMTLDIEAEDYQKAYAKACEAIDFFLQHLAISQGLLFNARTLKIEGPKGTHPVPSRIPLGSVRVYNLSKLAGDIKEAESSWDHSDERLARALEYFEHALFLFEVARGLLPSSGGHYALCVSESFLNLWKCATSIVGDPGIRKDAYHKRCEQLGLDETQKEALTRITRLRNDYDVAHYSLSPDRMRVVQEEFGKAVRTISGVVRQYREHLRKGEA
jgi:hypothetical protein